MIDEKKAIRPNLLVQNSLLKDKNPGLTVVLSSQYLPPNPKVVARVLSNVIIAVWVGMEEFRFLSVP